MITESDLRAVLSNEARDIGEPDDMLARLSVRAPTRRRWLAPVAAAAVVAAVVASAVALVHTGHDATSGDGHTLPPMPGRPLRFAATVGPPAGYQITNQYIVLDREVTELLKGSERDAIGGEVDVYLPGRYDPSAVRHGRAVTINGHTGYYNGAPSSSSQVDHVPARSVPTLAWEFAPDQWAAVQGWQPTPKHPLDTLTEEIRVARAVDTTMSTPLLLPYRVGHLPAGLRHGGGRATRFSPSSWDSYLWFVNNKEGANPDPSPTLSITARSASDTEQVHGTFTIDGHPATFDTGEQSVAPLPPIEPHTTVTPKPGVRTRDATAAPLSAVPTPLSSRNTSPQLTVDFGSVVVTISGNFSRAELLKIAESITLARDVNDPSTWYDAMK